MKKLAAALAMLAAGAVHAGPYDGDYRLTEDADCTAVGEEGGALRIADGIFYGVELECRMTNPVNVLDMDANLYTMQCSNAETSWTERAMVMDAADDGIIMVWNGYAFQYSSCGGGGPDEAAAATE